MILERFPPGQAEIRIIPIAMEGLGRIIIVSKKVKAGRRMNWEPSPMAGALGEMNIRLKSATLRSKATPNIIKLITKLRAAIIWGLKFNRI